MTDIAPGGNCGWLVIGFAWFCEWYWTGSHRMQGCGDQIKSCAITSKITKLFWYDFPSLWGSTIYGTPHRAPAQPTVTIYYCDTCLNELFVYTCTIRELVLHCTKLDQGIVKCYQRGFLKAPSGSYHIISPLVESSQRRDVTEDRALYRFKQGEAACGIW